MPLTRKESETVLAEVWDGERRGEENNETILKVAIKFGDEKLDENATYSTVLEAAEVAEEAARKEYVWRSAVTSLLRARENGKRNPELLFVLGKALLHVGSDAMAEEVLGEACHADSADTVALVQLNLARIRRLNGLPKEAMDLARKAQSRLLPGSFKHVIAGLEYARSLISTGEIISAETELRVVLDQLSENQEAPEIVDAIQGELFELFRQQGDVRSAQRLAMKLACTTPPDEKSLSWRHRLGDLYRGTGNYEKAEQHFRLAFTGFEALKGQFDPGTLETASSLGRLLLATEKRDQAESYLQKAHDGLEMHDKEGSLKLALAKTNYAQVLSFGDQEAISKAKTLCLQAERMYIELLGSTDWRTWTAVDIYGLVLLRAGEYAEAERELNRALKGLQDNTVAPPSISLRVQDHLIQVQVHRRDDPKATAENLLRLMPKMIEQFGTSHLRVISMLKCVAQLKRDIGALDESDKLYRRVLKLYDSCKTKNEEWLRIEINNIVRDHAMVLKDLGRLYEAADSLETALDFLNELPESQQTMSDMLICESNLAQVLAEIGKVSTGSVTEIRRSVVSVEDVEDAINTYTRGNALAKARNLAKQCFSAYKKMYDINSWQVAVARHTLALVEEAEGNNEKANELYDLAENSEGWKSCPPALQAKYLTIQSHHIQSRWRAKDLSTLPKEEQIQLKHEANELLERMDAKFGEQHIRVINLRVFFATALRQWGETNTAAAMFRIAMDAALYAVGKEHPVWASCATSLAICSRDRANLLTDMDQRRNLLFQATELIEDAVSAYDSISFLRNGTEACLARLNAAKIILSQCESLENVDEASLLLLKAKEYALRAVDTYKAIGENDWKAATATDTLGIIHLARKDYQNALNCFKKALATMKDSPGVPISVLFRTRANICSALWLVNKRQKSINLTKELLGDCVESYGENHLRTEEVRRLLQQREASIESDPITPPNSVPAGSESPSGKPRHSKSIDKVWARPRVPHAELPTRAIFISHSRRNQAALNATYAVINALCFGMVDGSPLCSACFNGSLVPWLDAEQMTGGENWQQVLFKAQQQAPLSIFMLSRYFHGSDACALEIELGVQCRSFEDGKAFGFFLEEAHESKETFDPKRLHVDGQFSQFEWYFQQQFLNERVVKKVQGVPARFDLQEDFVCDECRKEVGEPSDGECEVCSDWGVIKERVPGFILNVNTLGKFIDTFQQ